MTSKRITAERSETMALRDKNTFTQKLRNLLLSETSIGGQLENRGRIKKVFKKTNEDNLKVSLFLLKPLYFSKYLSINVFNTYKRDEIFFSLEFKS